MKVRIGIGTGGALAAEELAVVVDAIDELGLDSLWLSEVLTAPVPDPLVALAFAAAHSPRIKLGTTMLLPGRNPVRLAKECATLDGLSGGRLLLTFVPGLGRDPERAAIGLPTGRRNAAIDEVLPLLRRLWAGEVVSHHGEFADFEGVKLAPLPHQQPLEAWLGGMAPSALERCGRLADGWLPSLCTPEEAAKGKAVIDDVAGRAERLISPEHFGISVGYARAPLSEDAVMAIASRARGHDPRDLVPVGLNELRRLIERFVGVGFSKFVVRPLAPPADWRAELEEVAAAVGDLQS
jgi:probable F420-dependent oxidoreductase